MNYSQRDLVWLNDPPTMPDGEILDHPVLIISCRAANCKEDYYTAIMMTASSYRDKFSYLLEADMFESPTIKKGCQLRLYIIFSLREFQIKKFANRMKLPHFKPVLKQISDYVLCADS